MLVKIIISGKEEDINIKLENEYAKNFGYIKSQSV